MSRRRMMLATVGAAVRPILYFRPSASTNGTGSKVWVTKSGSSQSNLHLEINEEIPDDSDMIYQVLLDSTCRIKLNGTSPAPGIERAILRVRTATTKSNGVVQTWPSTIQFKINGVVYLEQGNTPGSWLTTEVTIPIADVATWDLSDLWVDLKATEGNNTNKAALAWMVMEFQ